MIQPRLKVLIVIYLWAALVEDTVIFVLAWLVPELWFQLLHAGRPAGLENALLRRSAGQWAAFALAQGITLWRWRKDPAWLAVSAGVRFSDLFTDVLYILAVPSLTTLGWILLVPPFFLNVLGVVILLRGTDKPVSNALASRLKSGRDEWLTPFANRSCGANLGPCGLCRPGVASTPPLRPIHLSDQEASSWLSPFTFRRRPS